MPEVSDDAGPGPHNRGGRPRIGKRACAHLPDEVRQWLDQEARRRDRSRSQLMCDILTAAYQQAVQPPAPGSEA